MEMEQQHTKHHIIGYSTFVGVWLALLMLTALTVAASGLNLHALSVLTAICIATIKTLLVLYVFMHLKYEEGVFKIMLSVAVVTLAIFIGLTFSDIPFR